MRAMERQHRVKKSILRFIAGLTLHAFIFSNLFFTDPAEISAQVLPISETLKLPEAFSKFPTELGKIEAFSLPAPHTDKPFVYMIQDAHESPAAQENIFKILSFLKQKGQLDLLLLEGATGTLQADRLRPFKDEAQNKRFLEMLSQRGLVNGAVRFLGNGSRLATLGLEDSTLYRQNLETYRSIRIQRDKAQAFLNRGEVFVAERTRKMLDPRIMLFLRKWKTQQENPEGFGDYLKFLLGYAAQSLKVNWHDYALQQSWPQLVRVSNLLNADLEQDLPKLEKETKALQRELRREAPDEMAWLQRTVEAEALFSRDFRETVTSPRRMAENLVEKAQARNISWVRYPALTQFLSAQILQNEIVPEALFTEIQTLEKKIAGSLSRDPQAGAWMEFFQDFYLLKQALSLNLRREQAAHFRAHFKGNWTKSFSRFLGKGDLPEEQTVSLLVEKVLEFYAQAESREDAFFSALLQRFPESSASRNAQGRFSAARNIVIVTGGYHKEGLKRKIDRFHIPYGVITPRLKAGEGLLPYQKIMMGHYAETSTLGPAQVAVMNRSEARDMIGNTALQRFEETFAHIQRDVSGGAENTPVAAKVHEAGEKAARERFFQLIEHLNRLWWLRQEPPAFRDKEHLGFSGDHPNPKVVMGWSSSDFDTYKQSVRDIVRHRISEGRLEYVRFAWLAKLMNLRDALYPGEFPEIDAAVSAHAKIIVHQMSNYSQLIRGWGETILFEMFPPEKTSRRGAASGEKRPPLFFGKFFSKGPQIYERLEKIQESLRLSKDPTGLRYVSRELLDLDRDIRDVFSRSNVAQALADLRLRMHESTLSRFGGPLKVIEQNARYLRAYTSIYVHGSQQGLPQEILLAETVDAVLAIATHKLHVRIERDYEPGLRLTIPEVAFSEIVLNIARNAAQEVASTHSKGARQLRVSMRQRHADTITLSIRDSGEGVSEENLRKIKSRESFTTKAGGNGIGLPLSLRQIQELGGTWTVDSRQQSPDQEGWTEFTVTFPLKGPSRSEIRYVPAAFRGGLVQALRTVLSILIVAGLLSGCASTSRDLVREQIQSDRTFVLPQRPVAALRSVTVDRDSLALSLLQNDPVLREGGLQVMIRQAGKGRLDGSFSIRPRIGMADGKPVFSLGIGGNLPGIGSLELSGLGMGHILSAVLSLTGELSKFWEGEDLLAKALVEQAVEIANLDLHVTLGKRYLHFLNLAYEIKTREEQSAIIAGILKKIDVAFNISLKNQQASEEQRQLIRDLKAEWLLRLNELESSLKKSRGGLAALYAPGTLGETSLSVNLEYSRLPKDWKAGVAQEQALRDKALEKKGFGEPGNRALAEGYATRWLAATTQRLEEKKTGLTLAVGGFSFLDSYGSNPSSDLKTAVNPLVDQRAKDQAGLGISGVATFGGEVVAKRETAHLKVALAETTLEAVRQKIEKQISELLQTLEGQQNTIRLLEERNAQIEAYLKKARTENAITEDRLVRLVIEEEGNKIKMLAALQEITRGTEELRVLTWDLQGLPKVFSSRSELREGVGAGTLGRVRSKILRSILVGAMFFMMCLPFVKPSSAHAGDFLSISPSSLAQQLVLGTAQQPSEIAPAQSRVAATAVETNAFSVLDQELAKKIPGFRELIKKQNETQDRQAKVLLGPQIDTYRTLILKAVTEGQETSLSRYSGGQGDHDGTVVNEEIFFNYSNPFHSAWDHTDALESAIEKGNVRVDPEFKERVMKLTGKRSGVVPETPAPFEEAGSSVVGKNISPIAAEGPVAAGAALVFEDLSGRQRKISPERSVTEILLGASGGEPREQAVFSHPAVNERFVSAQAVPAKAPPVVRKQKTNLSPAGAKSQEKLNTKESRNTRENITPAEQGTSSKKEVALSAPPQTQANPDLGNKGGSQGSGFHGVALYNGKGQVVVNPSKPVTLRVPFPADQMSFSVKVGDVVEKGAPLVRGIHTERENRSQFLESRSAELHRLITNGQKNPGTLDRDTMSRYQFELAELSLELDRLTVERDADILLAPRAAMIQTLPQGPATDGGITLQIIPLDAGSITLPLSMKHFGFNDVVLSVNGERVTVVDWEADGFDLAKGPEGEFNLTLHFMASKAVTGDKGKLCEYNMELIRSSALAQGPQNVLGESGFHATVPASKLVQVGVPSVPGIPAGVFHAAVQDGRLVTAGDVLGTIHTPGAHEAQIRRAKELVRLAEKIRSSNARFNVLSESEVQAFEAKAQHAKASVKRDSQPVLVKAPVGGRVQGVTALEGQVLATGRITDAGVFSEEIFLGTSTDPRSPDWSNRLSNEDPHLISVEKGSVKKGDRVSVSTAHGVVPGAVYAVVSLANRGMRLYSGLDGVVIRAVDQTGILGTGSAVNIQFDDGKLASEWDRGQGAPAPRSAPALRVQNDLPPAIQQEFQMHSGEKIGALRMLELVRSEKNLQQRFEMVQYFMSPLGFRYINELAAALVLGLFALLALPKLGFMAVRRGKQKRFFRQDTETALQRLKNELHEIEMRLMRKVHASQADLGRSTDAQVVREIIAPMQDWVKLVWEHETLGSDERDTITTKASELAQSPLLRFSREHFEALAEIWKGDTHYLAKLRGLLARLAILTGKAADRQFQTRQRTEDLIEVSELLRFKEKMADFAENFNEGYNLAHRLIALSQVSDLYPPTLKLGHRKLGFSEWGELVRNRRVTWTFPVLRFLLAVSAMVMINRWVTLRSFRNVAENMQKLSISGFSSVQEAMRVAKEGLRKSFSPVASVDELEGNKLDAYYGRWLGRLMVIVGVLAVVQFPAVLALLGLSHLIAPGAAVFLQFTVPAIVIWRHVGPMLKKLSGEGYSAMRGEIKSLRRSVEEMEGKPAGQRRSQPAQPAVQASFHEVSARDEDLMMEKMSRALLNEDLRKNVETIVLLPPKHGENKEFFEAMVLQDEVLKNFDFKVAESDGLYPGDVGQFFAARDRARDSDKKTKIYWFPQSGVSFSVAMALFKLNLAEALRMAADFRQHGMEFGEILFPGGNLSSNAINYSKNGSNIVIDARLASLEEVKRERHPVLLGRNGSPRHDVEHVVRQPEDLQGVLSQCGQNLGIGLSLENSVTPQFPVSKGPLALISNNDEEREQMETLLTEFRKKIENLTGRYGPFPIDLLEDFAGVVAEFRRQFLENNAVLPNLQRLAHTQKTFPNAQDTAQPYGKIYGVIGRTLWDFARDQQQLPFRVEAFVPAPSDYLFVPGHHLNEVQSRIERIQKTFPELVNVAALERLDRESASASSSDRRSAGSKFVFNENGVDVSLTKETGFRRNLPIRKAAAFVIKDGKILFQQRNRQAASNPGLLDLPVFEQLEPGETPEAAVRRGFLEELRDGRPLPPALSELPVEEIDRISYQVPHEKRRHVPSTRTEDVSTFLFPLNGEFTMNDFLPGDDAIKVVAYSREELDQVYRDKHGIFTPRTYVMLSRFLPRIEEAMIQQVKHGGPAARSELRAVSSASPKSLSDYQIQLSLRAAKTAKQSVLRSEIAAPHKTGLAMTARGFDSRVGSLPPEVPSGVSEEIRILTAILVAKKILAHQDSALYPKLEASLRDSAHASERALPLLLPYLGVDGSDLKTVREKLRELIQVEKGQKQFSDNRVIFLDGGILSEEYFSRLERAKHPVVFAFDRRSQEHYDRISGKFAAALAEKKIYLVYAPDGLSGFIKQALKPGSNELQNSPRLYQVLSRFQGQDKAQDIAFIARDRNESRKMETYYIGHRYYYGPEFLKLDPELVFYSLQLLLRSPELFKEGQGREGQSIETFLGGLLRQILEAAQSEKSTSTAA